MKRVFKVLLWIVLIVAAVGAAMTLYGRENTWELFGAADQGDVNFATLVRGSKPNQFIICPADHCPSAKTDMPAPVYAATPEQLSIAFQEIAQADPLTRLVESGSAKSRFVQRTPLMRYPDTIVVEFLPVGEEGATFAALSRSQVGYSDGGENEKRLKRWIAALDRRLTRTSE